jgi:hypothetical protein
MTVVGKKFDRELFKKTDGKAKSKLIKLLKGSKFEAEENTNCHGVDLLIFDKDSNHKGYVEVEIKSMWADDFKWPDVNFLKRKEKYCQLDKKTVFVLFNKDLTRYMVVKDKDVLTSPEEVVKNKYNYNGEIFKKIPLNKVVFDDLVGVLENYLK